MHDIVETLPENITSLGAAMPTTIDATRGSSNRQDVDNDR